MLWNASKTVSFLANNPLQFSIDRGDWRHTAVIRHIANKAGVNGMGRLRWAKDMFPVRIGPSVVHGSGIFATRDVKLGELLTLYPVDAQVSFHPEENQTYVVPGNQKTREDVFAIHQKYGLPLWIYEGTVLQAVGFPELVDDPAYLGHMANDAVGPETSVAEYERKNAKRANASFIPLHSMLHHGIIATQPITAGSEILVSYGVEYWQKLQEHHDPDQPTLQLQQLD